MFPAGHGNFDTANPKHGFTPEFGASVTDICITRDANTDYDTNTNENGKGKSKTPSCQGANKT